MRRSPSVVTTSCPRSWPPTGCPSGSTWSPPDPLHLHATDPDLGDTGEWFVRSEADGVSWAHGHQKGQVAVRARAVDLLLAAMRRTRSNHGRVEVLGDPAVWRTWLERTGF